MEFFWKKCREHSASQLIANVTFLLMNRDENFRANNDKNIVVESLSNIRKTSICSCMKSRYKLDLVSDLSLFGPNQGAHYLPTGEFLF